MARRATAIRRARAEGAGTVLVFDAGGSLLGQPLADASAGRVIIDAMGAMGYDAMGVGLPDMAQGLETLLLRAEEAEFPFVSCNLAASSGETPLLMPYIILERGSMRCGILGVTGAPSTRGAATHDQIRVLDPILAVARYLPELRSQCDLVILLAHMGLYEEKELARAVPGIDIIVAGRSRRLLREPIRVGKTLLIEAGYHGGWLGRLDANWNKTSGLEKPRLQTLRLGLDIPDDAEINTLLSRCEECYLW